MSRINLRRCLYVGILSVCFAAPTTGQAPGYNDRQTLDHLVAAPQQISHPLLPLAGSSILGAFGGFLGGALLGYTVERRWYACECDDPGLAGALVGAIVGPIALTPLLAHVANGRRGELWASYAGATLVGAAGFLALGSLDSSDTPVLILTPLAQAISAVMIERITTK